MGVVYKAIFPSGKIYVGKTINSLSERKRGHKKEFNRKESSSFNTKFYRAIRKYEFKNIEWRIIEEVDNKILNEREIFYIEKLDSFKNGYNSTSGGDGPTEVSLETRLKISASKQGKPGPRKGKKHTEEAKLKMSLSKRGERSSWFGKKHTKETREKISNAQKGEKNHKFGKKQSEKLNKLQSERMMGEKNPMYGKVGAMNGKKHSQETREKISKAKKEWWRRKKNEVIINDDSL